jgi:hypothetical protein
MSLNTFGQRKKIVKKSISGTLITKLDKVSAEMFRNNLYLINNVAGSITKNDTIVLKSNFQKSLPLNPKITILNSKGNQFYVVVWIENEITTTKTKTEDATTVFTEVCDFSNKTKVLSNFQKTTKIKEIRFLDSNQTVSETIDKVRKEGNEIKTLADGDILLTNKKGETKFTYSPTEKTYILKKK